MADVTSIARAGFFAEQQRLVVAASNIANAGSTNYKAQEVKQVSNVAGGVITNVVDRDPATIPTVTSDGSIKNLPNVSLESEVVGAQVATYSARADLKILQTQDKLNKYLLDIQA